MDPAADLAAQLYGLADRDAYLNAAGELLSKLFPAEVTGWVRLDGMARRARVYVHPGIPMEAFAESLVETADDNPLFISYVRDSDAGVWRPRRLSDVTADLDLHKTRMYSEALSQLGIDRVLGILSGRSGPLAVEAWTSSRNLRDFTDAEVELAQHIQPMLRLLERACGDADPATPLRAASRAEEFGLTQREQEILTLLGKGLTGVAIGHLLRISPRTVAKHLEHAYGKLGCTNRIDALRLVGGR